MGKLDDSLVKLLTSLVIDVASDTLNEETVDYKSRIKLELIPELKRLFDYEELAPLEDRKEAFRLSVISRVRDYDPTMLKAFYNHWVAMGKNDRKMHFEKEKTWDLPKRLSNWERIGKKRSTQYLVSKPR